MRIFCEWYHKWSSFGAILVHVAWPKDQPLGRSVLLKFSLENFERQGITYKLLLEIFSMKKLNSLLYRNCSVNFFTVPPELTRVDFFPLHVTVCCKPRDRLRQNHAKRGEYVLSVRSAYNGRCDLCSLNSVVAVFSGEVTTVLKFCNLQIL